MSMFERVSSFDLDDSTPIVLSREVSVEVDLRRDFDERALLAEKSDLFGSWESVILSDSLIETLRSTAWSVWSWADGNGVELDDWTPEDERDEEDDPCPYENEGQFFQKVFEVIRAYPEDVAYEWTEAETIRHDSKWGKVVGSWKIETTWGEIKEDPALWAKIDALGVVVEIEAGSSTLRLTRS